MTPWTPADTPPDDDRTVLVTLGDCTRLEPHGERVWLGYHDGEWRIVDGQAADVTAWAELPTPPED